MNHKYIDMKTFDIIDNVFEVDEYIAETISILNKKGYWTKYCCSGHTRDPRLYEMYNVKNDDVMDDLELGYVVNKNEDSIDILMPYTFTVVYIMFKENFNFSILPDGFHKVENDALEKIISYYNDGVRKKWMDIEQEIIDSNDVLLKWAMSLPNRNR